VNLDCTSNSVLAAKRRFLNSSACETALVVHAACKADQKVLELHSFYGALYCKFPFLFGMGFFFFCVSLERSFKWV